MAKRCMLIINHRCFMRQQIFIGDLDDWDIKRISQCSLKEHRDVKEFLNCCFNMKEIKIDPTNNVIENNAQFIIFIDSRCNGDENDDKL